MSTSTSTHHGVCVEFGQWHVVPASAPPPRSQTAAARPPRNQTPAAAGHHHRVQASGAPIPATARATGAPATSDRCPRSPGRGTTRRAAPVPRYRARSRRPSRGADRPATPGPPRYIAEKHEKWSVSMRTAAGSAAIFAAYCCRSCSGRSKTQASEKERRGDGRETERERESKREKEREREREKERECRKRARVSGERVTDTAGRTGTRMSAGNMGMGRGQKPGREGAGQDLFWSVADEQKTWQICSGSQSERTSSLSPSMEWARACSIASSPATTASAIPSSLQRFFAVTHSLSFGKSGSNSGS